MRGSAVYQVMELFSQSGINCISQSKHAAKERARHDGAKTWQDIGMKIGIYSYGTADAYREVWVQFFKYAKNEFGMKDIEKTSATKVRAFLEHKIDERVAMATFAQYAAACMKLSQSLNLHAKKTGSSRRYDFVNQIDDCRQRARKELDRFEGVRAYDFPGKLINAIEASAFRVGAMIQLQGGSRLDEMALIRYEQLSGFRPDPITKADRGWIMTQGKGGKMTEVSVREDVYDYLVRFIQTYGMFRLDKDLYRRLLRQAAKDTGQTYSGSHGLRWNFAQRRMQECQNHGLNFDASLQQVSKEMGHERASITRHYLG